MKIPTSNMHTQEVRRRGIEGPELPPGSALCVTVPGAPALWEDTVKTFGKLSLRQVRRRGCRPRTTSTTLYSGKHIWGGAFHWHTLFACTDFRRHTSLRPQRQLCS